MVKCETSSLFRTFFCVLAFTCTKLTLNIAVPESPVVVGQTEVFPTITHNLTVSGTRAYLASDTAGVRIIDTSTPALPVQIGVCDTPGRARSVAISGDYAFVADETGHFQVCDISTPSTSAVVGAYPYLYSTYGVAISRNYAYVGANEFVVFDISTPITPQRIGSYQPSVPEGYAHEAIVVRDGVAFVGESMITSPPYVGGGVRILDVATPEFPHSRNFYDTPGTTKGLVLEGELLYIADETLPTLIDLNIVLARATKIIRSDFFTLLERYLEKNKFSVIVKKDKIIWNRNRVATTNPPNSSMIRVRRPSRPETHLT